MFKTKKKKVEKKRLQRRRIQILLLQQKKQRISLLADISIAINRKGTNISLMIVKKRLNKQNLYKLKPLIKLLLLENYRESRLY